MRLALFDVDGTLIAAKGAGMLRIEKRIAGLAGLTAIKGRFRWGETTTYAIFRRRSEAV